MTVRSPIEQRIPRSSPDSSWDRVAGCAAPTAARGLTPFGLLQRQVHTGGLGAGDVPRWHTPDPAAVIRFWSAEPATPGTGPPGGSTPFEHLSSHGRLRACLPVKKTDFQRPGIHTLGRG